MPDFCFPLLWSVSVCVLPVCAEPVCAAPVWAAPHVGLAPAALQAACERIAAGIDARVGIAVYLDDAEQPAASVRSSELYPMMSVVKLPLAVVVLQGVATGKWELDGVHTLTAEDLHPDTWSPLREAYPQGGTFTLRELLVYMLAQSDNNVCDYLFALVGGPSVVEHAMQQRLGRGFICIRYDESGLRDIARLSGNSASPDALCRLLKAINDAAVLSPIASSDLPATDGSGSMPTSRQSPDLPILPPAEARELLLILGECRTGAACLKAGLPTDARLEHKTGSGPMLPNGRISARNDVGIIRLPGGRKAFLAVLVADSAADVAAVETVMSRAAAAAVQALRMFEASSDPPQSAIEASDGVLPQ